jgi:hypothetical protein
VDRAVRCSGELRGQAWYAESPIGPAVLRYEPVQAMLGPRQLAARLRDPEPAVDSEWLPATEAVYGPVRLPITFQPE